MKISEQWLREWISPDLATEALAHQLTMAGLEVDAVEPVAGDFSGVVVAEILSAEQHPDADKLRVCEVATGEGTVQIVCGAPNARAGLKAPLARVGAVLPGNFKIKKAKLRGVESKGMLCAEAELEISEASAGLMELPADAPVGSDLRDFLQLDDRVIEIGLTPNRADCLGVAGIAREVGLLNGLPVKGVSLEPVAASVEDSFPVAVEDSLRCPRYVGRVIRNIDISRPTPLWMQEKLRRCGLRCIDAVVDVTNYVLLELGQPMHAFDLQRLQGGIVVRTARSGETLELLDGQTIELREDSLVIADHKGPVALAGIMGGEPTAVGSETRDLFLESAFFAPDLLAGQARGYGLHTDSSHRFERGVDFDLQVAAMERATSLLLDIVGGEAGPVTEVVHVASLPVREAVSLRRSRIPRLLGFSLEDAEVERILTGLGLGVTATEGGWSCSVPSWRFDLGIEADLLEELARVYGYNRLPVSRIRAALEIPARPEARLPLRDLRRQLAARGYREAITYSFIEPELQRKFAPEVEALPLSNPISADMAVMRSSLLPGLVSAVRRNQHRQRPRVRLFETGLRFLPPSEGDPVAGLEQRPSLAMVISGERLPESWAATAEPVDFYDLKGDLEALFGSGDAAAALQFRAGRHPALHPGQTAELVLDGRVVGAVGALHPALLADLDLQGPVFLAEIDLEAVSRRALPTSRPLSRFPEVRRDIAVLVDRDVAAAELSACIRQSAGEVLSDLTLFDVYAGKGIDPQRKSVAFGLTFRDHSRTLSDDVVNGVIEQVMDSLAKNYKAELRN